MPKVNPRTLDKHNDLANVKLRKGIQDLHDTSERIQKRLEQAAAAAPGDSERAEIARQACIGMLGGSNWADTLEIMRTHLRELKDALAKPKDKRQEALDACYFNKSDIFRVNAASKEAFEVMAKLAPPPSPQGDGTIDHDVLLDQAAAAIPDPVTKTAQ